MSGGPARHTCSANRTTPLPQTECHGGEIRGKPSGKGWRGSPSGSGIEGTVVVVQLPILVLRRGARPRAER